MTLNPSRNTLTLTNHTPRVLILTTSRTHNTPWLTTPEFTKYSERITLVTEWTEINTDVILFHSLLRKPKLKSECSKLESNLSQLKNSNMFLLLVWKHKQTIYIFQRLVKAFKTGVHSVWKSFKAHSTNKTDSVRIFKQTIDWKHETIDCFGLTTSQPTKTVFNLFKNT